MRRLVAAWVAGLACAQAPAAATAAEGAGEPVRIRADALEYERSRDLYVAKGRVEVENGPRKLRADWVVFSRTTGRGVASGDVMLTDGRDTLHTSFAEFDVENLEGVLFDARFDVPSGHLRMEGAEIAKTGQDTYAFEKGVFTTCRCPDPDDEDPWRLRAESAELEIGGYGTARDTTFEVLGVPVVWLPWALYPLKTERESGLLLPELDVSGRNGFEVGVPVFLALGDPVNATVTPRWLSKRGPKGDLALDWVVGEESGGQAFGAYLHDRDVEPDTLATPFGQDRWVATGQQDWFGPHGLRAKADYAFVSDNAYPNDFQEMQSRRVERYLASQAFVEGRAGEGGRFGFVASALHEDDRQNPDDTDRDHFVLDRLPQLELHALPGPAGPLDWLVPALDVQVASFWQSDRPQDRFSDPRLVTTNGRFFDSGIDGVADSREQGRNGQGDEGGTRPDPNFDDFATNGGTEGDGVFQEGELLAESGQRVSFAPRVGAPLRVADAFELYPEAGFRQILYHGDDTGFVHQGLLTGRLELRTLLRRRFGETLTHWLEPRLGWAGTTPTKDESETPLFVPRTRVPQQRIRELDLDNVTLDGADRIRSANQVSFGFNNRVYGAPFDDGAARLLADVTLLGLYDFAHANWGRLVLDGSANPWPKLAARFLAGFDPADARFEEGYAELGWRHDAGHAVEFGYRYIRDLPEFFGDFPKQNDRYDRFRSFDEVSQLNLGVRYAFLERWAATYAVGYSFERQLLLGNVGGIEYLSKCACWAGRVEMRQDRSSGVAVSLRLTLVGLGDDTRSPFAPKGEGPAFGSLDAF